MNSARLQNSLLSRLGSADGDRLAPHLIPVTLSFKQPLYEQGDAIEYLYFPESGVISLATVLRNGEQVETGTVGREGFAGLQLALGVAVASHRAFCQVPGVALRLPAAALAEQRDSASSWFRLLLRYVHYTFAMIAQSTACHRSHPVQARMSRWLLMTHDRVDGDQFPVTQEFLGYMLGVPAQEINEAGTALQRAGLIEYGRGEVKVLHRRGLEAASCECYARLSLELERSVHAWRSPAP